MARELRDYAEAYVGDTIIPLIRTALFTAMLALLLMAATTQYRQWVQYTRGHAAEKAGNAVNAIAGYEAAIHMYTPGSPLVERSARALWEMGQAFEARHDPERALMAYRSLRSSFYACRSLFLPGRDWIGRCDERIPLLERQAMTTPTAP